MISMTTRSIELGEGHWNSSSFTGFDTSWGIVFAVTPVLFGTGVSGMFGGLLNM